MNSGREKLHRHFLTDDQFFQDWPHSYRIEDKGYALVMAPPASLFDDGR